MLFALLTLAGCETQVWSFDAGTGSSRGGSGGGSSGSTATPCEGGVCTCTEEELQCEDACVLPSSDVRNCGACGQACADGERCREGRCECAAGNSRCGSVCPNLLTDPLHCGACNQVCNSGVCRNGTCG